MRKTQAFLVFALLVFAAGTNAQSQGTQQAKRGDRSTSPSANPVTQQTGSAGVQQQTKDHVQADVRVIQTPAKDFYDKAPFWVNVALAVAGFAGIGVGIWTLIYLRKQTQHMVTSERAWITVIPTDLHPRLYPAWEQGTPVTDPRTLQIVRHQLPLTIKNAGKTPAQIDEIACRYVRLASMTELPDDPDYGKIRPLDGQWIIPGENYYGTVDLETDNGILYERHVQALKARSAILFFFGIVKYRDVYGNAHETRFGLHYEFPIPGVAAADGSELRPHFRNAGPPMYNRGS